MKKFATACSVLFCSVLFCNSFAEAVSVNIQSFKGLRHYVNQDFLEYVDMSNIDKKEKLAARNKNVNIKTLDTTITKIDEQIEKVKLKEMLQNSNIVGPGHVTAAVAGGDHSADAAAGAQRILGGAAKATGNTELGEELQDSAKGIENVKSQTREQINTDNSKIPTVEDLMR